MHGQVDVGVSDNQRPRETNLLAMWPTAHCGTECVLLSFKPPSATYWYYYAHARPPHVPTSTSTVHTKLTPTQRASAQEGVPQPTDQHNVVPVHNPEPDPGWAPAYGGNGNGNHDDGDAGTSAGYDSTHDKDGNNDNGAGHDHGPADDAAPAGAEGPGQQ